MLQEGCRRLPNARPKPLDLYPASTSSPTLSSMALLISQEWNRFTGSTEDLALQLSIIIYIYSSVPGPMFLRLTWTLISPFYFGCLRLLTHLQDSTCTSPPWLPRLSWVPLFRPPSHLAYLCRSTEGQNSYISGTRSLHWHPGKSVSCISLQLLSLSSLHSLLSLYHASTCIPPQFVPLPNLFPSHF